MIIEIQSQENYILATIKVQEANLMVSEKFKEELIRVIDQGHPTIVVDFKQVSYVDSSFLGALVSALKYAMANKSDIQVVHLNKDVQTLFELIRMDKVFKIHSGVADLH